MTYGIILAAGKSRRLNNKIKKQFLKINDKPIFYYSIDKFLKIKEIDKIILVISADDKCCFTIKKFIKDYNRLILNSKIDIILGGSERYDSVFNALIYIKDMHGINSKDNVIIHDAARPNVKINDISFLLKNLDKYNALTLSYNVTDTIKVVSSNNKNENIHQVKKTLDRTKHYLISTPQGFKLKLLYECYSKFYKSRKKPMITDDLQIIEMFSNIKTYLLNSSKLNIKITTQDDINMIKYLL